MNVTAAYLTALYDQFAAELYDAVRGATGTLVDFRPWYDELQPTPHSEEPKTLAPTRFEACCACPKCGRMDYHRLREPLPAPAAGPARVIEHDGQRFEVHRWGGMTGPDESMYEVIRLCTQCAHEWGQI